MENEYASNIPISRDGTVIQREGEIILKYQELPTETAYVEFENKSDTSNNRGIKCLSNTFGKRKIHELH